MEVGRLQAWNRIGLGAKNNSGTGSRWRAQADTNSRPNNKFNGGLKYRENLFPESKQNYLTLSGHVVDLGNYPLSPAPSARRE